MPGEAKYHPTAILRISIPLVADLAAVPWAGDLFDGVPQVTDGFLQPSNAPGLGVSFNEKAALKPPHDKGNFLRLLESGREKRNQDENP